MKEEHVYRLELVFADGEDSTCTSLVTSAELLALFPWLRVYEAAIQNGEFWELTLSVADALIKVKLDD